MGFVGVIYMDLKIMEYALTSKDRIEKMVENARKQGMSEGQIKQIVKAAVDEMCKKIKGSQMI